MIGTTRNLLVLAVILPAVAGCGTQAYEPLSADFGNAVRHNMAVQVVNPDPPAASDAAPTGSGARAALAYNRYETGKVVKPQTMSTSGLKVGDSK
ncbi:MAG TPA: hypothetical protein VEB64_02140 [Azospirillaceae bacterium]|nr:hypothetical protein [Azospirillaceae bacterium]